MEFPKTNNITTSCVVFPSLVLSFIVKRNRCVSLILTFWHDSPQMVLSDRNLSPVWSLTSSIQVEKLGQAGGCWICKLGTPFGVGLHFRYVLLGGTNYPFLRSLAISLDALKKARELGHWESLFASNLCDQQRKKIYLGSGGDCSFQHLCACMFLTCGCVIKVMFCLCEGPFPPPTHTSLICFLLN